MPVITLEGPKMTKEKKEALIKEFTKAASDITGISPQAFIVLIKENDMDNIGSGGEMLSKMMEKKG